MSRRKRILLNLLLPPILAVIPLVILWLGFRIRNQGTLPSARDWRANIVNALPFFLVASYVSALIPSLLFSLFMERVYTRGCSPASGKALAHSGAGGAGALIATCVLLFSGGSESAKVIAGLFEFFISVGAGTGLLVGLVVQATERRAASRKSSPA